MNSSPLSPALITSIVRQVREELERSHYGHFAFDKSDFFEVHTAPHHGNKYFFPFAIICPYIVQLIEQIGREHFVTLARGVIARDDEALTLWNLAYDEDQHGASFRETRGRS